MHPPKPSDPYRGLRFAGLYRAIDHFTRRLAISIAITLPIFVAAKWIWGL